MRISPENPQPQGKRGVCLGETWQVPIIVERLKVLPDSLSLVPHYVRAPEGCWIPGWQWCVAFTRHIDNRWWRIRQWVASYKSGKTKRGTGKQKKRGKRCRNFWIYSYFSLICFSRKQDNCIFTSFRLVTRFSCPAFLTPFLNSHSFAFACLRMFTLEEKRSYPSRKKIGEIPASHACT